MLQHYSLSDIEGMEKVFRLNLINSITGYKPANLIGTVSPDGQSNLAIISSVVHLGSNPAIIGFILRPTTVPRHTYANLKETGYYTINHVHESFIEKAHYTSAKFEESEFDACKLTEEYKESFKAPFVKESVVQLGMEFEEEIPIKTNGTLMIVGRVKHIFVSKEVIAEDGMLELHKAGDVCISGVDGYHKVSPIQRFPYARVKGVPKFE